MVILLMYIFNHVNNNTIYYDYYRNQQQFKYDINIPNHNIKLIAQDRCYKDRGFLYRYLNYVPMWLCNYEII